MANIQEYLNKILLARYGKEVRGSIHDAIQAMNTQVEDSETSAGRSAIEAATKASEASAYAEQASTSANNAANSANQSESYATGDTGSAKYYYEQARTIIESLSGALRPMGTVPFANLPDVTIAVEGDMYNISDEFTTTSDFKEGSGVTVAAGSNVYKTTDGHWDVLAGSPVTGIKGDKESSYRRGNVNITTENIGAVSIGGDIADNIVTFTSDDCGPNGDPALLEIPKLTTGEKLSSLMQKVSRIANNFRYFLQLLGTTDISAIGDGTLTGGLVSLNDNLTSHNHDSRYYTESEVDTKLSEKQLSVTSYTLIKFQTEVNYLNGYAKSYAGWCMFNVDFAVPFGTNLHNDNRVYVSGLPKPNVSSPSYPIFVGVLRNTASGATKPCYIGVNENGICIYDINDSIGTSYNEVRVAGMYMIA